MLLWAFGAASAVWAAGFVGGLVLGYVRRIRDAAV